MAQPSHMFTATAAEVKVFEKVNTRLDTLTKRMYRRTANLYRTLLQHGREQDFDDDYIVDGSLQCSADYDVDGHSGKDETLRFDNDRYYGSDFAYMIPLIGCFEEEAHGEFGSYIEDCGIRYDDSHTSDMSDEQLGCYDIMDDGQSWNDGCLHIKELGHVVICHAVHSLCVHHAYSIADLLRINRYSFEAKIVCQHITDQQGRRWKDLCAEHQ